jgi:hypothetical protein
MVRVIEVPLQLACDHRPARPRAHDHHVRLFGEVALVAREDADLTPHIGNAHAAGFA